MDGRIDTLEMYVPDIVSEMITFDKALSKTQIENAIWKLEQKLDVMVLTYECRRRNIEILYSSAMKKTWGENGIAGAQIRYVQKDVKGEVIEDMCREGALVSGETFFVSCQRSAFVSFGNGKEVYDITTLQFI